MSIIQNHSSFEPKEDTLNNVHNGNDISITKPIHDSNQKSVIIKLYTNNERLKFEETTLSVLDNVDESSLSSLVNSLLELGGFYIRYKPYLTKFLEPVLKQETGPSYTFFVEEKLLQSNLSCIISSQHLSRESVINIEFEEKPTPPSPFNSFEHDDWVKSIFLSNKCIYAGLFNGKITISNIKTLEKLITKKLHNGLSGVFFYALRHHVSDENDIDYFCNVESHVGLKEMHPVLTIMEHTDCVMDVQWTDVDEIVSCSLDESIRIWDMNRATTKLTIGGSVPHLSVDYSKENGLFITGSTDPHVRLWDARTTDAVTYLKRSYSSHSNWVSSVKFLRGNLFFSGSYDGLTKMWDLRNPSTSIYDMLGHEDKIFDIDYNDEYIGSASADGKSKNRELKENGIKYNTNVAQYGQLKENGIKHKPKEEYKLISRNMNDKPIVEYKENTKKYDVSKNKPNGNGKKVQKILNLRENEIKFAKNYGKVHDSKGTIVAERLTRRRWAISQLFDKNKKNIMSEPLNDSIKLETSTSCSDSSYSSSESEISDIQVKYATNKPLNDDLKKKLCMFCLKYQHEQISNNIFVVFQKSIEKSFDKHLQSIECFGYVDIVSDLKELIANIIKGTNRNEHPINDYKGSILNMITLINDKIDAFLENCNSSEIQYPMYLKHLITEVLNNAKINKNEFKFCEMKVSHFKNRNSYPLGKPSFNMESNYKAEKPINAHPLLNICYSLYISIPVMNNKLINKNNSAINSPIYRIYKKKYHYFLEKYIQSEKLKKCNTQIHVYKLLRDDSNTFTSFLEISTQLIFIIMKALIQRVSRASVLVDSEIIGAINQGLCVFIGISKYDTIDDMNYVVRSILNLRLFNGPNGEKWHLSVKEKAYEILCISQFTLQSTLKGCKPDFRAAMPSEDAKIMYDNLINGVKNGYDCDKVKCGKFQAFQKINIENNGPVTIMVDSSEKKFNINKKKNVSNGSENIDKTRNLP
ncbi:hypothetical protein A3Q56_00127 [Intoshia linei]|uniref:D-aminoacyl-tRNA deacylase n=1 Tax=Intoshia linei TaxID=1819745 RepID=A0A177BEG1_9BILA|nr:hypothetical protein A3Q56_00127 [Intoshia linei]